MRANTIGKEVIIDRNHHKRLPCEQLLEPSEALLKSNLDHDPAFLSLALAGGIDLSI